MLIYSADALAILARAYIRATKAPASRLGLQSTGNANLFKTLFDGRDCLTHSARRASDWFDENWPEGVPWPREVPVRAVSRGARKPSTPPPESRRRRRAPILSLEG